MAKRTIAPRQETNDTASQMNSGKGFWLDYEHLRLAVQSHEGHWQAFVFDRKASLVLYRVERNTTHGAKVAAVEFALFHLLGPAHGQDPEEITERVAWRRLGRRLTQ
jgi:hypothetical protein